VPSVSVAEEGRQQGMCDKDVVVVVVVERDDSNEIKHIQLYEEPTYDSDLLCVLFELSFVVEQRYRSCYSDG
jgi:hypothetical protein